MRRSRPQTSRLRDDQRKGIASLECALCLPIVILITFGTIDLCSAMFLRESITIAAYEGARIGVTNTGTNANCIARVNQVLNERNINFNSDACSINATFETADVLDPVTVSVTVPCAGNLALSGWLFSGRSVQANVTMRKEFSNNNDGDD